jgi:predicted nucleotidyltransferase
MPHTEAASAAKAANGINSRKFIALDHDTSSDLRAIVLPLLTMKPSEAFRVHRAELREIVTRHGALRPRVFGSAVRGDDSDLDLLVDPTSQTTLMTLAAIQLEAERLLGVRVDVLTPKSLPQRFRDRVLLEAIPV